MKLLERRLLKLEKLAKTKYNHPGVFIVYLEKEKYALRNEDIGKTFNSRSELDEYVYANYECEKYVFIDLSDIFACLDENGKLKMSVEDAYKEIEKTIRN